jgi:hypothetical protein
LDIEDRNEGWPELSCRTALLQASNQADGEFILDTSKDKLSIGDFRKLVFTAISTGMRIGGQSYISLAMPGETFIQLILLLAMKLNYLFCSHHTAADQMT